VKETGCCERCNSTENLHGHHMKPVSTHPHLAANPWNIKVLCGNCHALEHPELRNALTRPRIRSGEEIACLTCGKLRYVKPCHAGKAKFCSRKCHQISRIGEAHPKPGKEIACTFCGKLRYMRPACAARKFCSVACWRKSGMYLPWSTTNGKRSSTGSGR
jgi:hypothetical protein